MKKLKSIKNREISLEIEEVNIIMDDIANRNKPMDIHSRLNIEGMKLMFIRKFYLCFNIYENLTNRLQLLKGIYYKFLVIHTSLMMSCLHLLFCTVPGVEFPFVGFVE